MRWTAHLSRLGRFGSTAAVTALAVCAAVPLHVMVRWAEGLPVQPIAMLNLASRSRWSLPP